MRPGCGAIVAMLETAAGVRAFSVGKPSPVMLRAARKELGLTTDQTVVIGDTMETDILGGRAARLQDDPRPQRRHRRSTGCTTTPIARTWSSTRIADLSHERLLQEFSRPGRGARPKCIRRR